MATHLTDPSDPVLGLLRISDSRAFAPTAAAWLALLLQRAPGDRAAIHLALSGGSTPGPVYERLALQAGLSWERVRVYFADERCVPPDDPASNYRLARETLLSRIPVPAHHVFRMEGERSDVAAEASRYEGLLPGRLDVLVLGIGSDGHTASLFPGAETVGETRRRVLPARSPIEPRRRLTITPPVIRQARQVVVLARGEEKASAVQLALEGPVLPRACPARLARRGTWILDEAAACRLSAATRRRDRGPESNRAVRR